MEVLANMAGSVWKINTTVGEQVQVGQEVLILESMKMEIPIAAETAGEVIEVLVNEGDFVNDGDIILKLK